MAFSFLVVAGNQPPPNYDKSAAIRLLWGEQGHCYIFEAPANTTFYSAGAEQPVIGKEIDFPYLIESADIKYYCSPIPGVCMAVLYANSKWYPGMP